MSKWDTKTAEWYAEKYGEYATNRFGVEALKLESDFTIVDIGCGTGCALRHASEQVTKGSLIGIDPVSRMIEIAQERTAVHSASARVVYHQGSAEILPIEDASVDVVLAFDSYDHWADQPKGLEEVRRVLKSNGRFVVVKDGGLPNGNDAKKEFIAGLIKAGFKVLKEKNIQEDDVIFTQWICVAENEYSMGQA
ncbi:MAG: class I SAM-dependent methyltransferase [Gammaproteobacteria bacterium]|nr:class I SAM-dependent methyltransferase [Gammaproteobacteria bacterium]MDX2488297.1 class I SAM-dependent methyltransferase [Gammaproteobacteria bacterium]